MYTWHSHVTFLAQEQRVWVSAASNLEYPHCARKGHISLLKDILNQAWKSCEERTRRDWRNMRLLITQAWSHFIWRNTIQKVDALIESTTKGVMLFSCKFLWKRAPTQPTKHTPERDFVLWVMAGCKGSILPTPRSFPLFRNFFAYAVPKLPGGFNPRGGSGVQTDGTHQDRNSGKDEWASWRVLSLWHYKWFMDNQPPTLSFSAVGSWGSQWLQESLIHSFPLPLENWTSFEMAMLLWKSVWKCCCCYSSMERGLLLQ